MKQSEGMGIAALVLSIVGFLLSFRIVGIVFAMIGLILGIIALDRKQSKGICISAIVCASVAAFIALIAFIGLQLGKINSEPKQVTQITGTEYVEPVSIEEDEPVEDIWASEYTPIDDFRYHVDKDNHTITLIKYDSTDQDIHKVMISPVYTIDGEDYAVTSMGTDACFFGATWIDSIIVPEGVTYIEPNCFNSCGVLNLYLPSTLEKPDEYILDYLHDECNVYCNSKISLPSDRDMNNYELRTYGASSAEEIGKSFAGALNGLVQGLNEDVDNPTIVNIYFGGTDEQWSNIISE